MSFAPEDPRRHEEEKFAKLLIKAHARVFELAHEHCHEVRALMIDTDATYPDTEDWLADKVQLSATQLPETGEMTVKVILGIHGMKSAEGGKELIDLRRKEVSAQLRSRTVRKIFRLLEPEHREVIAEYLALLGHREAEDQLEGDYERLAAMHQIIEGLRTRILSGELPVSPPTMQYQSEPGYYGFGGGI